jgi:hypothetical protein
VLVEWIARLTAYGHPLRHPFFREIAQEIQTSDVTRTYDPLNLSPPSLPIGDSWVQHFLHRHSELETKIDRTIKVASLKDISPVEAVWNIFQIIVVGKRPLYVGSDIVRNLVLEHL